jgi:outer membrane immunogenic protein
MSAHRLYAGGLAIAGVIGFSVSVLAADLPAKTPVYKASLVAPAHNWSGWYAGANAGYGFSSNATTDFTPLDPGAIARRSFVSPQLSENRNGFLGGFQIGLNQQTGKLVYGLEADLDYGQIKGSATGPAIVIFLPSAITTSTETKLDWFGTVRGRLGIAAFDRSLIYATGGLAYGRATSSTSFVDTGPCALIANFCSFASTQKWKAGWTLGAGWEYAFAAKWSAKLEYLYYDLGTITNTMTPANGSTGVTFGSSTRINGNIVRAGLNYKFN